MKCTNALGVVLVAVALRFALDFALRREFEVPESGAVLITGTSSGIGKHACLNVAASLGDRFTVYCTVRKQADATKLEEEGKGKIKTLLLDITKEEDIVAVAAHLSALKQPLVGLVNNAGAVNPSNTIELEPMTDVRWVFDVNYFGTVRLTQALTPLLRKSKGRIVSLGSVAGIWPSAAGGSAYAGTKHAIEAFSDSLRQELAAHGVSVSLIEPAMVQSDIIESAKARKKERASAEALSLYPNIYGEERLVLYTKLMDMASPASVTTDAILHSLMDPYPQTRYVVANIFGVPAWLMTRVFWLVPDRLADAMATLL